MCVWRRSMRKTVEFTFEQKVRQVVKAFAVVPDDLETEDEIVAWLMDNPDTWNDDGVQEDDVLDTYYDTIELVKP